MEGTGNKGRKEYNTRLGKVNNDDYSANKNTFYNLISPLLLLSRQVGRTECLGRKETKVPLILHEIYSQKDPTECNHTLPRHFLLMMKYVPPI